MYISLMVVISLLNSLYFSPDRIFNFVSARDCCYLQSDKRPDIDWISPITGDFRFRRKSFYRTRFSKVSPHLLDLFI